MADTQREYRVHAVQPPEMPALKVFHIGYEPAEKSWDMNQLLQGAMMTNDSRIEDILVGLPATYANAAQLAALAARVHWQIPDVGVAVVTCEPALAYSIIKRLRERGIRVFVPIEERSRVNHAQRNPAIQQYTVTKFTGFREVE